MLLKLSISDIFLWWLWIESIALLGSRILNFLNERSNSPPCMICMKLCASVYLREEHKPILPVLLLYDFVTLFNVLHLGCISHKNYHQTYPQVIRSHTPDAKDILSTCWLNISTWQMDKCPRRIFRAFIWPWIVTISIYTSWYILKCSVPQDWVQNFKALALQEPVLFPTPWTINSLIRKGWQISTTWASPMPCN